MAQQTSIREAVLRLQELYYKYNQLVNELLILRSKLSEIREAKRILSNRVDRRIYREIGRLVIEVSREEALKYLEDEEEVTMIRIEKLEGERKKLLEEIRRLEKIIGK